MVENIVESFDQQAMQCNAIQSNKVQEDKESGNKARAINLQVHHEERGKGRKKKKKERKN